MDALDQIISPLKGPLTSVTHNLPEPVRDAAISLLGNMCYKSLIYDLDFSSSNQQCFSLAISKALGIAIVSASAIVKLPQLIKLVSSQSAKGLSFLSFLLETASFVITLAYNVRHGFPFSTFGETAFITIQNVAIATLILVFSGKAPVAAAFVAALAAALYALFAPQGFVDTPTLGYLQAGAGALGIAAKLPQIYTIWSQGSTGQLSAFAVFNYLFGSLVRIFTTLKEVDDKLILYGFVAGFALNAVIATQMLYYWNSSPATKSKSSKKSSSKSIKSSATKNNTATTTASSTATPARKGPSTRRRG